MAANDDTPPIISIRGLYKVFGSHPADMLPHIADGAGKTELLDRYGHVLGLSDINIDVPARCVQVIMGLSGSGKSTLIRHINRLIEPTAGEVMVAGQDIRAMTVAELRAFRRHQASMVFQRFALLPHRTVAQNIAYGLHIQGVEAGAAAARVNHWIERVGLQGFADHYPVQLSGGMQQRVGLGRALATDAEILLMDEAFSALDPLIRTDMQRVLLDLQSELKRTIVFITHDLDEALRIGDRIAILRDGEVVQDADPQEIILRPADDYIAEFTKDINRARVVEIGSIMAPPSDSVAGPRLAATMKLEDAARAMLTAHADAARVINAAGKIIGSITLRDVTAAMIKPGEDAPASPRLVVN